MAVLPPDNLVQSYDKRDFFKIDAVESRIYELDDIAEKRWLDLSRWLGEMGPLYCNVFGCPIRSSFVSEWHLYRHKKTHKVKL